MHSRSAHEAGRTRPSNAELYFDIYVLKDLDSGDLRSARERVNDDCMFRIFQILERIDYTTNKDTLLSEPGLRAAARYWGHKELPTNAAVFNIEPRLSNTFYHALSVVSMELDKKTLEPDTAQPKATK
jgi:hypothetical protein